MWNLILHVLITAAVNWATHSTEYVEQKKATLERNWRQRLLSSPVQTACCLRWVRMRWNHFHTTKGTTSEFPTLPRPPLKRVDILVRGHVRLLQSHWPKATNKIQPHFLEGTRQYSKDGAGPQLLLQQSCKGNEKACNSFVNDPWWKGTLERFSFASSRGLSLWQLQSLRIRANIYSLACVVMEAAQLPIGPSLCGDNFQALRPIFYWIISHVCTSLMTCASSTKDVFKLKL